MWFCWFTIFWEENKPTNKAQQHLPNHFASFLIFSILIPIGKKAWIRRNTEIKEQTYCQHQKASSVCHNVLVIPVITLEYGHFSLSSWTEISIKIYDLQQKACCEGIFTFQFSYLCSLLQVFCSGERSSVETLC